MVESTPFAMPDTDAETPSAVKLPARATAPAARAAASARAAGTASAPPGAIAVPRVGERCTPRRSSRARSRCRPRASRLWSVPIGQPSRRAAWSLGQALQVAEHDRRRGTAPAAGRSPRGRSAATSSSVGLRPPVARTSVRRPSARAASPGRSPSGRGWRPTCHLVEPGAQGVPDPERAGPAHQHQEGGLEGVVGVVLVREDRPADAQDHRPVPLDQGREGQLGPLARRGWCTDSSSSPSVNPAMVPSSKRAWTSRSIVPCRSCAMSLIPARRTAASSSCNVPGGPGYSEFPGILPDLQIYRLQATHLQITSHAEYKPRTQSPSHAEYKPRIKPGISGMIGATLDRLHGHPMQMITPACAAWRTMKSFLRFAEDLRKPGGRSGKGGRDKIWAF